MIYLIPDFIKIHNSILATILIVITHFGYEKNLKGYAPLSDIEDYVMKSLLS